MVELGRCWGDCAQELLKGVEYVEGMTTFISSRPSGENKQALVCAHGSVFYVRRVAAVTGSEGFSVDDN